MSPRHPKCCTCHTESSCRKSKMTTLSQNATFDPFKTSSKFTKYSACHAKWPPKAPLILTQACQRFSNVQKVPRLSDIMRVSRKNDVLDLKMSRMSHACHTKWTSGTLAREFPVKMMEHPDLTPAFNTYYRKNPSVWTQCLGNPHLLQNTICCWLNTMIFRVKHISIWVCLKLGYPMVSLNPLVHHRYP